MLSFFQTIEKRAFEKCNVHILSIPSSLIELKEGWCILHISFEEIWLSTSTREADFYEVDICVIDNNGEEQKEEINKFHLEFNEFKMPKNDQDNRNEHEYKLFKNEINIKKN